MIPLLAHFYSPADYGNYALGLGLATFLVTILGTGFGLAFVRLYPEANASGQGASLLRSTAVTSGAATATAFFVTLTVLVGLRGHISAPLLAALVAGLVYFVPLTGLTVAGDVLRAQLRPGWFTTVQWLSGVGTTVLSAVVIRLYRPPIFAALFVSSALALSAVLVAIWAIVSNEHGDTKTAEKPFHGPLWSLAWPLAVGGLGTWGFRLSDRYVIDAFLGSTAVGIYSSAFDLSERVTNFLSATILTAIQPIAAHNLAESLTGEDAALGKSVELFVALAGGILIATLFGASVLVKLLLGPAFQGAAQLLGMLALGNFLVGMSQFGLLVLVLQMRQRTAASIQLAAAGLKIGFNFLLVPRFGIMGAALTSLIASSLLLLAMAGRAGRPFIRLVVNKATTRIAAVFAVSCSLGLIVGGLSYSRGGWREPAAALIAYSIGMVAIYARKARAQLS